MDKATTTTQPSVWEDIRAFLWTLPRYLRVRPDTGKLWLDACYLVVIAAAQYSFVSYFLGRFLSPDIITPWLVVAFVRQPTYRHLCLGALGGLLWEAHSSAPLGTYLCAYWILAVMVGAVRETFSWQHWIPWLTTFAMAEVAIVMFEITVIFVSRDPIQLDFYYTFAQLLRIGFATAFGALICRRWIVDPRGEEADR